MGMDDGASDGFDVDQVKARLTAAVQDAGMSFEQLCRHLNVTVAHFARLVSLGTDAFPESLDLLQRASVVLGRPADWLAFGVDDGALGGGSAEEKVRRLVWEFIFKWRIDDRDERNALLSEAVRPLHVNFAATASSDRFRARPVFCLKDVARLYQNLRARQFRTD